jgi:nuclear transport factor 2 (NTF2) superfamily protein
MNTKLHNFNFIEEKKYFCIKSIDDMYKNEIYIIKRYEYKGNNTKFYYKIYDSNDNWKHSCDEDSPFYIRLSENFITLKELRKQKLQKLQNDKSNV